MVARASALKQKKQSLESDVVRFFPSFFFPSFFYIYLCVYTCIGIVLTYNIPYADDARARAHDCLVSCASLPWTYRRCRRYTQRMTKWNIALLLQINLGTCNGTCNVVGRLGVWPNRCWQIVLNGWLRSQRWHRPACVWRTLFPHPRAHHWKGEIHSDDLGCRDLLRGSVRFVEQQT